MNSAFTMEGKIFIYIVYYLSIIFVLTHNTSLPLLKIHAIFWHGLI